MKKLFVITLAILILSSGIIFLYSCGGGGGGGDASATYYADMDGDGFGDVTDSQVLDSAQAGWVLDSTDCDDDPAYGYSINPGAVEACDDWTDNDCNDLVDCYDDVSCNGTASCDGCLDTDLDSYYAVAPDCYGGNDCAPADSTVNPGVDVDGDTINACNDCNDADSSVGAGTTDVCNGSDDDCDGFIDEEYDTGGSVTYTDWDGTTGLVLGDACGTGECSGGIVVCGADELSLTCDTESAAGPEICNGLDDDCNGAVDDGNPGGGGSCNTGDPGVCASGTDICVGGNLTCVQDISSSAEVCNGLDDDCDGLTDEQTNADCGSCQKCLGGSCVNQVLGEDVKDDCAAYTCTDLVWGLSGSNCYRNSGVTITNGDCDGAGACASVNQSCTGPGSILASCGSECVNVCPGGANAVDYNSILEVCYTDSLQHGCTAGQVCDATGMCVPE